MSWYQISIKTNFWDALYLTLFHLSITTLAVCTSGRRWVDIHTVRRSISRRTLSACAHSPRPAVVVGLARAPKRVVHRRAVRPLEGAFRRLVVETQPHIRICLLKQNSKVLLASIVLFHSVGICWATSAPKSSSLRVSFLKITLCKCKMHVLTTQYPKLHISRSVVSVLNYKHASIITNGDSLYVWRILYLTFSINRLLISCFRTQISVYSMFHPSLVLKLIIHNA